MEEFLENFLKNTQRVYERIIEVCSKGILGEIVDEKYGGVSEGMFEISPTDRVTSKVREDRNQYELWTVHFSIVPEKNYEQDSY